AKVDAIKDAKGLAREVAHLQARGAGVFFGFGSQQDFKDATKVIGGADQGGLGLPDRDYYLKDDAKMKELRALYESHVVEMLKLAGTREGEAQKQDKTVMGVEAALERATMER